MQTPAKTLHVHGPARVAELGDASDSKSDGLRVLWVRVPPRVRIAFQKTSIPNDFNGRAGSSGKYKTRHDRSTALQAHKHLFRLPGFMTLMAFVVPLT